MLLLLKAQKMSNLLQCGSQEKVGGDDINLVTELIQAHVVSNGEYRDSILLPLVQILQPEDGCY